MKAIFDKNEVRIECTGIEFLKLKAELSKRLGKVLRAGKFFLTIPVSSLHLVEDILANTDIAPIVDRALERFRKHESARNRVTEIVEGGVIEGVSARWMQLLDPAQSPAVSAMILPDLLGLCLFDEQGSGKTVMTIAAFDILKETDIIDSMIVACPKSMIYEWSKDIERFLPNKYSVVISGGDRWEKFQLALNSFDVLITNYEGIEHIQIALAATSSSRRYLLVADESYYVKNSEAIRSEFIKRVRTFCDRCFVLCGTPAPNSSYDLINQFNLADSGYTFGGFVKSNDVTNDRSRITSLIESRGSFIRRLKSEILREVPDKCFTVVRVKMKGRQAILYEKARSELELELHAIDNSSFKRNLATYLQRRSVLLQICAIPRSIDPSLTCTPVKYEYLDTLLSELVGKGRKVVLWSFFKNSIDELVNRYNCYNPIRIDGSVDRLSRKEAVTLFQEDPKRMVFIGNPAAAGAGITLHSSYDAVYISYSNQAAHYLQSLDRIHRRGQKAKEVNYYLLVCEGTIEETEVIRLRGKELQQHSLFGDQIPWPSSLDEALSELQ